MGKIISSCFPNHRLSPAILCSAMPSSVHSDAGFSGSGNSGQPLSSVAMNLECHEQPFVQNLIFTIVWWCCSEVRLVGGEGQEKR